MFGTKESFTQQVVAGIVAIALFSLISSLVSVAVGWVKDAPAALIVAVCASVVSGMAYFVAHALARGFGEMG